MFKKVSSLNRFLHHLLLFILVCTPVLNTVQAMVQASEGDRILVCIGSQSRWLTLDEFRQLTAAPASGSPASESPAPCVWCTGPHSCQAQDLGPLPATLTFTPLQAISLSENSLQTDHLPRTAFIPPARAPPSALPHVQ